MDYPQQQTPNLVGAIQGGYELAQNSKMNNLKMLAAQQEMDQKNQLQSLYKLASTGNPQAAQQLSMVAPQAYEGLQKYQTYKTQKGGQLANSVLVAPEPLRPELYQKAIEAYKSEFGVSPNIPSEYSPEAAVHLKSIVAQARQVEDVAKEQQVEYSSQETSGGLMNFNKKTGEYTPAQSGGRNLGVYVKPPTSVVNVNNGEQPAFRKKLEETYGTKTAERLDKINTDADNAVQTKQWLGVQREALANLPNTGVLDSSKIYLGNLANQLGVKVDMGKISSLEQLSAAGNTITIPLVKQLGYNPTDADARLIGSTIANIGKGKATNLQLNDLIDQASDKQIAKAQIADSLRAQGRESELTQELRNYDLKNPIKVRNPQEGQSAPKAPPQVGMVKNGFQFLGGNPASPNSWRKL